MPLEEVERVNGGDKAWERSREAIGELADLLKNKGGPFFLGETCKCLRLDHGAFEFS